MSFSAILAGLDIFRAWRSYQDWYRHFGTLLAFTSSEPPGGLGGTKGMSVSMVIPFLTARRRQRLLSRPFAPEREETLIQHVPLYRKLPKKSKDKLRDMARVLIAEKHWEACGKPTSSSTSAWSNQLTDEMKLIIAAQAALLLLGLGLDPLRDELYPNVKSVLVYPGAFITPPQMARSMAPVGPVSIMSEGFTNLGEAWHQGPVILSWAHAQNAGLKDPSSLESHNVVLHEFAHKLDMLDGAVNGTPPLESLAQIDEWKNVMTSEFIQLSRASAMGLPTVMSPYGATNPGEFFAVATETFFENPVLLRKEHSKLYETLAAYYHQDPAALEVAA